MPKKREPSSRSRRTARRPMRKESNAADKHTEADEITEIDAPPPTTATGHTLTAETPMPSSPIGCSTGIGTRTNGWDPTATPTKPSDTTVEPSEEGRVYGTGKGRVEFLKGTDKDLEYHQRQI